MVNSFLTQIHAFTLHLKFISPEAHAHMYVFQCVHLAKLPFQKVTPEGVIFVAQWAILAVLAYWILSFILRLVVGAVRQVLWLLKLSFAVGTFGLILSDTGASAETTALRLAGLACVCVLLGIGTTSANPDAHLENKVKMLERRLKEMEKRKME